MNIQQQPALVRFSIGRPMMGGIWLGLLLTSLGSASGTEPMPAYAQPKSLRAESRLNAIAFADSMLGLAVGDRGAILRTQDGGATWTAIDSGTATRLEAVNFSSPRNAIAVGGGYDRVTGISRGLVLTTDDGGRSWRRSGGELPKLNEIRYDRAGRRWIAKGDLSFIDLTHDYESTDGGRTWRGSGQASRNGIVESELGQTQQNAARFATWIRQTSSQSPMRCLFALNSDVMMAAGDHGVIMRSMDAGATWSVVHGSGRSTAVLVVTSRPERTPWQLIGIETLEHQRRVSVLWVDQDGNRENATSLTRQATGPNIRSTLANVDRLHQSVTAIGGAGVDRCDARLPPSDQEWIDWLTTHSPMVLALDRTMPADMQQRLMGLAIQVGVPRVIGFQANRRGDTLLHQNALLPRAGVLAVDVCDDAMLFLSSREGDWAGGDSGANALGGHHLAIDWMYDAINSATRGDSITSGLPIRSGHRFEAILPAASRRDLQVAQARSTLTKKVDDRLANVAKRRPSDAFSLTESIDAVFTHMEPDGHLRALMHWLDVTESMPDTSVNREATRQILNQIATRFDSATAGKLAGLILGRRDVSLEHTKLPESIDSLAVMGNGGEIQAAATDAPALSPFAIDAQAQQASAANAPSSYGSNVALTSGMFQPKKVQTNGTVKAGSLLDPRFRAAVSSAPAVESSPTESVMDLQWDFHPLSLIVNESERRHGDMTDEPAENIPAAAWQRLATSGASAWSQLLFAGASQVIVSPLTKTRPHLDGVFDEPTWEGREDVITNGGIRVRFAHDEEFIYLAAVCPLMSDHGGENTAKRARDNDLDSAERLSIHLDVDQDLLTSFELEVSADRQTRDRINGDIAWQPTWYVARRSDEKATAFEIAILRSDLVDLPVGPQGEWFVDVSIKKRGERNKTLAIPDPSRWKTLRFVTP